MTERITSMPEQTAVACVQLPGHETDLARGEMANTSGGCLPPRLGFLIIREVVEIILDVIENYDGPESISEWRDSEG